MVACESGSVDGKNHWALPDADVKGKTTTTCTTALYRHILCYTFCNDSGVFDIDVARAPGMHMIHCKTDL